MNLVVCVKFSFIRLQMLGLAYRVSEVGGGGGGGGGGRGKEVEL